METKKGRLQGRFMLCVFRDNELFDFIGLFLNNRHVEDFTGVHNANVDKYVKGKSDTCKGYIIIQIDVGDKPINVDNLEKESRKKIEERTLKQQILHLNRKKIEHLSGDDLKKINQILNKNGH